MDGFRTLSPHNQAMAWLKGKAAGKPTGTKPVDKPHTHNGPHVPRETQDIIANFLVSHRRVELRNGHPQLHFMGMSANHMDGSVDYAVRSRVHGLDGKMHKFDSHVRIYASGHLKLIR
jgi:hypothetical protein